MHGWKNGGPQQGSNPPVAGHCVSSHEGAVCWTPAPDVLSKVFTWVCSCLLDIGLLGLEG